jgi:polyisoprenoid-binding protein YceI
MKKIALTAGVVFMVTSMSMLAQSSGVNLDQSTIKWEGKKIGTKHYGTIQLQSGSLEMQNGQISGGVFVVDMTSIKNEDISNEDRNQRLVGHLKSDDFFSVESHPTSSFKVTGSTAFADGKATLSGDITIKGKTEPISFEVVRNNNAFTAKIPIDRSKFDVRYGSDSFFDNLGNNAIDDIFTLEVKLVMN